MYVQVTLAVDLLEIDPVAYGRTALTRPLPAYLRVASATCRNFTTKTKQASTQSYLLPYLAISLHGLGPKGT